jgi:hypothetical protein
LRQDTRLHGFFGGCSQQFDAGTNFGFFYSENGSILPDKILVEKSAGQTLDVVFFDGTKVLLRQAEFIGDL